MLYLDFHPMDNFSRKDFLYNKALATTLEGSRKFLGGTSARSRCDEPGSVTKFWDILEKYRRAEIHEWARGSFKWAQFRLWENDATGLGSVFKLDF